MNYIIFDKRYLLTDEGKLIRRDNGEEYIPGCDRSGYRFITRRINGKNKTLKIHQLVMQYFGPPMPGDEYEIDHINRIRTDNRLKNLRWVTRTENLYNTCVNLPVGQRCCDYSSNEEYHSEYSKQWQKKHRNNCNISAKKYSESEKGKTKQKEWRENNKDKIRVNSLKSNRKRRARAKGFDSWEEYQAHKHALI